MATLYLIESRAARTYLCAACGGRIPRGTQHFRHDPFPPARIHRGQKTSHWCYECILASNPGRPDPITRRLRVPVVQVLSASNSGEPRVQPIRIDIVGVASALTKQLAGDPQLVHRISPEEFEEFVCDRLFAMGLEPKRVGDTNRRDGGVDIVFWPRSAAAFPFLGAAQVKHHRDPRTKEGPSGVRDFAGVLAGHPFNAGILVTNTSFSADAQWFAHEHAQLMRLRGFRDIRRWMFGIFDDDAEWREIPTSIELCPGVILDLKH